MDLCAIGSRVSCDDCVCVSGCHAGVVMVGHNRRHQLVNSRCELSHQAVRSERQELDEMVLGCAGIRRNTFEECAFEDCQCLGLLLFDRNHVCLDGLSGFVIALCRSIEPPFPLVIHVGRVSSRSECLVEQYAASEGSHVCETVLSQFVRVSCHRHSLLVGVDSSAREELLNHTVEFREAYRFAARDSGRAVEHAVPIRTETALSFFAEFHALTSCADTEDVDPSRLDGVERQTSVCKADGRVPRAPQALVAFEIGRKFHFLNEQILQNRLLGLVELQVCCGTEHGR